MTKTNAFRQQALQVVIRDYAPQLVDDLFQVEEFISFYGLHTSSALKLGTQDASVSGPIVFAAIRHALSERVATSTFEDQSGKTWSLEVLNFADGELLMRGQGVSVPLSGFWTLLPDGPSRLEALNKLFAHSNMPEYVREGWQKVLELGPLTDEELLAFFDDVGDLDSSSRSSIQRAWQQRNINPESGVPRNRRYFEWRAGTCGSAITVEQYVKESLKPRISTLITRHSIEGFRKSLDFCVHSSISEAIDLSSLTAAGIAKVFADVRDEGTCFAKVGAVEVGLMQLEQYPELADVVGDIVEQICEYNPDAADGDLQSLYTFFLMVEGELCRLKLFPDAPPFYRRLLSFSQAALLASELNQAKFDRNKFGATVMEKSGYLFYLQTLCDLRSEPRWLPDFAAPNQLKNEALGRIWIASQVTSKFIVSNRLKSLLLEAGEGSVRSHLSWLAPFLPGPMEGGLLVKRECPPEINAMIDEALARDPVDYRTFVPIINAASLYQLEQRIPTMVSDALKRTKYYVLSSGADEPFDFLLQGLAQVAATQRDPQLAEDLLILVRNMASQSNSRLEHHKLPMVGLIAAAGYADITGWSDFVGRWFGELAFSQLDKETMQQLYLQIEKLIEIEPVLYLTLSRAKAAALSRVQADDPSFS